jgi:hypothetical protein
MYVKPSVRKGLLGRMLTELLATRVMVKQAMKGVKGDNASSAGPPDHFAFKCLSFLSAIGAQEDSRCQATWSEVYCQCHVWIYQRHVLWSHACRRDRGQHSAKWSRDSREGDLQIAFLEINY